VSARAVAPRLIAGASVLMTPPGRLPGCTDHGAAREARGPPPAVGLSPVPVAQSGRHRRPSPAAGAEL
jgi:hypothetical protein